MKVLMGMQSSTQAALSPSALVSAELHLWKCIQRRSAVMADEAHERSLATDTLLGFLVKLQRSRPDLRKRSSLTICVSKEEIWLSSLILNAMAAAL